MLNGSGKGIRAEDAAALITTLNQIQPYVPPMIFNQLANNPISLLLADVANRRMEIEVRQTVPTDFSKPVSSPPE